MNPLMASPSPLDTIVAPATPRGSSALAVVRLTGPASHAILRRHWQGKSLRENDLPAARTMHTGIFTALPGSAGGQSVIRDAVVVCRYTAPASYTGEDMVELYCHGNPLIVDEMLRTFQASGARLAQAGEFTRRAFLNGKIDLVQAEAVAQVIAAENEEILRRVSQQYSGAFSKKITAMRQQLIDLCGWIEADLDFGDREVDDVTPVEPRQIKPVLQQICDASRLLLSSVEQTKNLRTGFRVVLVGKPNVGKSSLFNRLSGDERALVDETPGTTRDYLEAALSLKGFTCRILDTAGLSAEATGLEARGIERSREQTALADVAVAVFDRSQILDDQDQQVLQTLAAAKKPVFLVSNKIDCKPAWDNADLKRRAGELRVDVVADFDVSALNGDNLEALLDGVALYLQPKNTSGAAVALTHRQAEILGSVYAALERALATLEKNVGEECLTHDLRLAVAGFSQLLGREVDGQDQLQAVEEMLDQVFSQFCIGK